MPKLNIYSMFLYYLCSYISILLIAICVSTAQAVEIEILSIASSGIIQDKKKYHHTRSWSLGLRKRTQIHIKSYV